MKKLSRIMMLAFGLRILVALLGEHGDVINYYWWSKDLLEHGLLGFYDRSIANAMPPTYPPVTSYIFWLSAHFHQLIWKVAWFVNVKISLFPSNFIFWFESARGWYFVNKFPVIIADMGIIWILFHFVKELKNKKAALLAALFFAFVPPFWYTSALWGQTDSIYIFFVLAAFFTLHKSRVVLSVFLFVISALTKPTSFFVFPAFALWWVKRAKLRDYYWSVIVFLTTTIIFYSPFQSSNLVLWVINFYQDSLGGELDYIVANAFNFWGLIHGFDNVSETTLFLGLPSNMVGYFVYVIIGGWILLSFRGRKKIDTEAAIFLTVLTSFAAFLVLPRMHERYFYPTLLLLVPLAAIDKKLRKIFYLLSTIHLINLYHFWWVPRMDFLVGLFSNNLVEKMLIIANIGIFVYLLRVFRYQYVKKVR